MIRLLFIIFIVCCGSHIFLTFLFGIVDKDVIDELPKGCKRDGDCPVCSKTTIMYTNPEDNIVAYWCEHCDWNVSYIKDDDGMWRKK